MSRQGVRLQRPATAAEQWAASVWGLWLRRQQRAAGSDVEAGGSALATGGVGAGAPAPMVDDDVGSGEANRRRRRNSASMLHASSIQVVVHAPRMYLHPDNGPEEVAARQQPTTAGGGIGVGALTMVTARLSEFAGDPQPPARTPKTTV
ncbi:hypothetical protein GUJ93_ZPchr0003g17745 [Zizania palustris]|uniref:Uncharacterized protein n=1 Tax=Zizania palustris TaxID=103762 RepID=A0A8J5RYQ2_ZIZPA|nr:hypothetical protein GUJ93_ZPchr0003g17745 [Zizania palustris]